MRFLAILVLIGLVYLVFVRSKPTPDSPAERPPVAAASARPEETSLLKQPIDRTKEALKANNKRIADDF